MESDANRYGARSVQSLCAGGCAPAQSKRCAVRRRWCKFFVVMACPKSFGWTMARPLRQRRSGPLAPECVVAALGDRGGVCRPAHPEDNGAHEQMHRVLRAEVAKRPRPASRRKNEPPRLDPVLQSSASSRSIGPARSCKDLLAEQSADAGAIVAGGISLWWQSRRVRNRGHIKCTAASALSAEPLSPTGGTQNSGRWCPRSLFPAATDRLALRARSVRNATGCNRATSLTLTRALPRSQRSRRLSARLNKRRLRRPAIC